MLLTRFNGHLNRKRCDNTKRVFLSAAFFPAALSAKAARGFQSGAHSSKGQKAFIWLVKSKESIDLFIIII